MSDCVVRADASSIIKTHACYASDNNNTRLGLTLHKPLALSEHAAHIVND